MGFGLKKLMGAIFAVAALTAIPVAGQAQRPPPPPLPDIPPTPVMSGVTYPDCLYQYREYREPFEKAAATTRCTEQLDAYHGTVLAEFRVRMIEHQEALTELYESQVMNDFAYTQEQADGFYAEITQEHADSNPDGRHMARLRGLEAQYEEDREYLQERFCRYSEMCADYQSTAVTAERDREDGTVRATRRRESDGGGSCDTERAGGGILGGLLGGIVGEAAGIGALGGFIAGQFAGVLVAEIACQLEPEEQEEMATATETVTEQEEVGATAEWVSPTRADVSGSSTVTALNSQPNGATCMDVTDVVIISGEETRISKRMCRGPGEARYTLAA
ncbi:hypothetical protein HFP51_02285 [Parasphingopyxis sp. CP4]|uniref:hypothetical protein n=1 Tax=Parasphingopyxis sp. CP4 TaxID=2724527 RepID=UPI0015A04CCD|nr:hypothetical protein [Parasphingopyxis sp. CP4]QLC21117.1 hypothetical protein HFP51_02285 [Parasphingopyxis sp. CP4]